MSTLRFATFALETVLLGSALASGASITADTTSPGPLEQTGLLVVDLASSMGPNTIHRAGYTITFDNVGLDEGVVSGNTVNVHATPVAGQVGGVLEYLTAGYASTLSPNRGDGNYLSTGLGTITISFDNPMVAFELLWGSIDTGNKLSFNDSAKTVVTGSDVQMLVRPDGGFINGSQDFGGSAYVVVRTDTPFTSVQATSSVTSFEFDGLAAIDPVPEPVSFSLIGAGLGLIALLEYRRRGKRA